MHRLLKLVLIVVIIGAVLWLLISSARQVGPGQKGVLVRFGAVDNNTIFDSGLHLVNIFAGESIVPISVQTQKASEKASAASKDLQDVSTVIATNYHLNPKTVNKLYRDTGLEYETKVIQPISQEAIKQVTAQYNAGELITQRETVKQKIEDVLVNKLQPYGITVDQVSITDFNFSPEFDAAVEATATAKQKALQATNDLNRIKIEAQQKIAVATGQKNSTIQIAEGDKQSAILRAEGVSQSADIINQALEKSPLYLQYKKIDTWNGQLPRVVGSGENQIIAIPSDLLSNTTK